VADNLTDLIEELCVANRILSHEGVLDAFGHVSVRHPSDPNRYLLARSRSPLLIEPDDILEYKLDSEPVKRTSARLYSERVIHGCIYQGRGGSKASGSRRGAGGREEKAGVMRMVLAASPGRSAICSIALNRDLKELRVLDDPGSAVHRFTLHRVRDTMLLLSY
jgi:hypothetical protein